MATEKVVRAFKSHFPDSHSMILPDGTRFSFTNNYIKTDDPKLIAELERLVELRREIEEVDPKEVDEAKVKTAPSRIPKDMGKSTTISPEDLQARIAAAREAAPAPALAAGITNSQSMKAIAKDSISK